MNFGADIPFVNLLGITLEVFDGGEAVIFFTPGPDHVNSFGVAHGGVVMTLLDVAMATAARSVQKEMGVVTIEMKTSFMRPSPAGVRITTKGRLMHRTASLGFVEGMVYDDKDQLCVHATGTFKYVKRLLPGAKGVNDAATAGAVAAAGQISTD